MKKLFSFLSSQMQLYSYYGFPFGYFQIRKKLAKKGVNIGRYRLFDKKWLRELNIKTVLDIGANVGEFTSIFNELFPNAVIHAFEPLPECFNELDKRLNDSEEIKKYNIGLGKEEGELIINRSSHNPASSFRKMGELHKENYPHSSGYDELKVSIKRLDDIIKPTDLDGNVFIKMDVQGFEDEVIKGGLQTFSKSNVIVVESSYQKLYENEPMFHGIYSLLYPLGYEFVGCLKQSSSNINESYLQGDAIFLKK